MKLLHFFGIGNDKIIATGIRTTGKVTRTHTCWYIKVNMKPVRSHALDGARFPHIFQFEYEVNGNIHTGRRFVDYNLRCPLEDERIAVYYDPENPARYAVEMI